VFRRLRAWRQAGDLRRVEFLGDATTALLDSRNARVGIHLLTGISLFVYWVVVRPTAEASPTQSQWPYVLWFSATILTLAFALPAFGRMIGGKWVVRLALAAGAAAAWNSAVNIVEDGFGQDWAFALFALGSAGILLSNIALAIVLAVKGPARRRALSLIPLGTAAGILGYVSIGGPVTLLTWLAAAAMAARWRPEWTEEADSSGHRARGSPAARGSARLTESAARPNR
jgi:hypothetical protein